MNRAIHPASGGRFCKALACIRVPLHEILGEKHRDNQGEVVCGYHDKQGMA
jgi:hypothetical protein